MEKLSTVILSAGFSKRMQTPKALLKWNAETTFLEKIINEYILVCDNIICVINKLIEPFCNRLKTAENVIFVVNEFPEKDRFYSLKTGLKLLPETDFCMIQDVDNPFINKEIILKILENRNSNSWLSPVFDGKSGHPVLIPEFIIQKIVNENNINKSLHEFLMDFPKTQIEINSDFIFRNINTPEDYVKYFQI